MDKTNTGAQTETRTNTQTGPTGPVLKPAGPPDTALNKPTTQTGPTGP